MNRTALDHRPRILGIPVKPILLWGAISMTVIAQANWRSVDRSVGFPLSLHVAITASVSLLLIAFALWKKSQSLLEAALLAMFATYAVRTTFIWLENGFEEEAGWFGVAGMALCALSYMLERFDYPESERHRRIVNARGGK